MFWKVLVVFLGVLTVHLCQETSTRAARPMKLIIDTDAGGDDAVAILLALASKEVQVIAITCVYGNTDEANVETNVLKILTVAGRSDIPVYGGAKKPLLQNYTAGDYFGKDGLGDFEFGRDIVGRVDSSKHAALAMVELVRQYSGNISILTLGPLTNVALAASLDPSFTHSVNRIYVMGSAVQDPKPGIESENREIEFNFSLDSESNAIVLNSSTKVKSFIAPWDVVVKNSISKEWRMNVLGSLSSEAMIFLNKVEHMILKRLTEWLPADSIAVATMIWPDLITSSIEARMSSVTYGPLKGSVLVETEGVRNEDKNVEIVRDFNVAAFKDKLLENLA